jgi:hypothetical protein
LKAKGTLQEMMDTTSSIKNDRIKKENKLQITKVTPPKKKNAI